MHIRKLEKSEIIGKKPIKRWLPLILVIALLATVGAGTFAFLHLQSGSVTNNFDTATISCVINEDFTQGDSVKKDVTVSNTGTAYVKVRAAVNINWHNSSDGSVSAKIPVEGTDYTVSFGSDWTKGEDGFWYYNDVLKPGDTSTNLINSCRPIATKPGYTLMVDVAASAIQADKASSVWG